MRFLHLFSAKPIDKKRHIVYNNVIIQGRGAILKSQAGKTVRNRCPKGMIAEMGFAAAGEACWGTGEDPVHCHRVLWSAIGSILTFIHAHRLE